MSIPSDELRAAILTARAAALNAEVAGMVAANQIRITAGYAITYTKMHFDQAIEANRQGESNVILVAAHGEL